MIIYVVILDAEDGWGSRDSRVYVGTDKEKALSFNLDELAARVGPPLISNDHYKLNRYILETWQDEVCTGVLERKLYSGWEETDKDDGGSIF